MHVVHWNFSWCDMDEYNITSIAGEKYKQGGH